MTTMGENQERADAATASGGSGSASVEPGAARPTSSLTARTIPRSARVGRSPSTLEPLRGRPQDRERRAMADALAHERRRIAADVHDLIMQDLALALATARTLTDCLVPVAAGERRVAAGERALAGARYIVGDLAAEDRKLVIEAVEAGVRVAARHVPLSFNADGVPVGMQPDQPTLDALVHIGREAVTNAIKHAEPTAVEVVLEYADEWRLQVRDDGRGFDATDAGWGFGLESMTRHAHALGGSLRVTSAADARHDGRGHPAVSDDLSMHL